MAASSAQHRAALEAAVAGLPTVDDDSWTIPDATLNAAGLRDDVASARKFVLQFALWARGAIDRLPPADSSSMQATDFNDYYKIVMSRVQYLYAQAASGAALDAAPPTLPLCCFQTQLRRRPSYKKGGAVVLSGVFDLKGSFKAGADVEVMGSLEASKAAYREALEAVGARTFDGPTLRHLVASRSPKAAAIEDSLAPLNEHWIRALHGKRLFTLLPDGAEFSEAADEVEVRMVLDGGTAVVLAQGPWYRVTFCETPLLQCMSQFFTDQMNAEGDDDGAAWCREAMMNFATTVHQATRTCQPGAFSLFSGRRTPNPAFHLLQHMYITEALGGMATSSLFAGRVLGAAGMAQQLIGTLAHEGPMGMMALHPELDANVPLSSLLWHVLFWAFTSNRTILPDGHGSAVFRAMLDATDLLGEVVMARQDSGSLARFSAIFSGQNKMASEIEKWGDVETALSNGYVAFGAGGFFGEKRRVMGPEFSLAAKLTRAVSEETPGGGKRKVGYAAKLGDCAEADSHYSWAEYPETSKLPAKFIVSPDAPRAEMYRKMLGYASKGDAWWDQRAAGRGEESGALVSKSDAHRLAQLLQSLAASPALSAPPCAQIAERLRGYATRIEAAAGKLA